MRTAIRTATLCALVGLANVRSVDAQTIDTRQPVSNAIAEDAGIYGQSFTVDASYPFLNDFSVFVAGYPHAPSFFRTYLYAFNGTNLIGPALFTSALQTAAAPDNFVPYPEFTFSTSGLALTPGGVYMAIIQSAASTGVAIGYSTPTPTTFGDVYPGGQFYSSAWAADPQTFSYQPAGLAAGNDIEFVAHFSATAVTATPEPASLTLVATGLVGVVGAVRRRRRAASAA